MSAVHDPADGINVEGLFSVAGKHVGRHRRIARRPSTLGRIKEPHLTRLRRQHPKAS
jgi:hypothetical protein